MVNDTVTATMTLFQMAGQNGTDANTRAMLSARLPCGISDGIGLREISGAVELASRNAKYSG